MATFFHQLIKEVMQLKMSLLIDSGEFWKALKKDIDSSQKYIYILTLSFEGDSVGKMLSDQLITSKAVDIRILIDQYTRYILSDHFLYAPENLFDSKLRLEAKETKRMISHLNQVGIKAKFTNPVGFFFLRFPARNHKKMLLIDDAVAYIGGINFSEHNFDWHDMMLRIEDEKVTQFLKEDFITTWNGKNLNTIRSFPNITFYVFDGCTNEDNHKPVFALIEKAEKSIFVESPYLSFPFYERLREARQKGVAVTLITPEKNNRKNLQHYSLWEARRSSFNLHLYRERMTHLKAMLIDDRILIMGSSNFDYLSYCCQQEIMAVVTDREIISEFKERVIIRDLKNSIPFDGEITMVKEHIRYFILRSLGKISVTLCRI